MVRRGQAGAEGPGPRQRAMLAAVGVGVGHCRSGTAERLCQAATQRP